MINGYNGFQAKQWEHSCENYKKYMACIEKTKDYCSPESSSGLGSALYLAPANIPPLLSTAWEHN